MLALAALALSLALAADSASPPADGLLARGKPALDGIRAEAVSAHIRFLADDLLEGRYPGTKGHALAEAWVASQLQAAGLEPAGEGGSWFQEVPLRSWKVTSGAIELAAKGGPVALEPGKDVVLASDGSAPALDATAPLVFAGYGVVAPEYGWDDLAGLDLRGRIAVVFAGAPGPGDAKFFPPIAHAVAADARLKYERLRAKGATGMLLVWTPAFEKRMRFDVYARYVERGRLVLLVGGQPSAPGVPVRGAMTPEAFDRLLAASGEKARVADLTAPALRRPARATLRATARVRTEVALADVVSRNVLGRLRGSDPALAAEHVLFTAHLDHLGVGDPVDGDAIYNGAVDDAAGVAVLVETARAMARLSPAPQRSLVFAAVTAEEQGLLGSEHLARHAPVPLASVVANVNLDGTPVSGCAGLIAVGAEESTLDRHVRAATAALGLGVTPDPFPEQVLLIRSDQWSFIREGVPAVFPVGDPGGPPDGPARQRAMTWWKERYHRPSDAWDPSYDYEGMARYARAVALLGLSIAEEPSRPRWNAGSYFRRFAAGAVAGGGPKAGAAAQ